MIGRCEGFWVLRLILDFKKNFVRMGCSWVQQGKMVHLGACFEVFKWIFRDFIDGKLPQVFHLGEFF